VDRGHVESPFRRRSAKGRKVLEAGKREKRKRVFAKQRCTDRVQSGHQERGKRIPLKVSYAGRKTCSTLRYVIQVTVESEEDTERLSAWKRKEKLYTEGDRKVRRSRGVILLKEEGSTTTTEGDSYNDGERGSEDLVFCAGRKRGKAAVSPRRILAPRLTVPTFVSRTRPDWGDRVLLRCGVCEFKNIREKGWCERETSYEKKQN